MISHAVDRCSWLIVEQNSSYLQDVILGLREELKTALMERNDLQNIVSLHIDQVGPLSTTWLVNVNEFILVCRLKC